MVSGLLLMSVLKIMLNGVVLIIIGIVLCVLLSYLLSGWCGGDVGVLFKKCFFMSGRIVGWWWVGLYVFVFVGMGLVFVCWLVWVVVWLMMVGSCVLVCLLVFGWYVEYLFEMLCEVVLVDEVVGCCDIGDWYVCV